MKTISKTRFHLWWILVLVGAAIAAIALSGCTIDRYGNAAIETPKASVSVGDTGYTVYAYGVIGVSKQELETSPK